MRGVTTVAGLSLAFAVGILKGHLDRQDEAREARIAWEQAQLWTQPSIAAKTLLCRIEQHRSTILATGIAPADSFQAVQSRLNALWDEYCRLDDQLAESPAAAGMTTLGNE